MPLDLSRLDDQQRAAVTAPDGSVLVLAGAGSGKTRTLTARVAWLIEQGVPPAEIVAVTFTRKAAEEMRSRVYRLCAGIDLAGLRVNTFHALMATMLRREPEALARLGRDTRFTIWDDDDSAAALRRLLRERGWREHITPAVAGDLISRLKTDGELEARRPSERLAVVIARQLLPLYEAAAREGNAFDYDDLLVVPVELMHGDADLRRRWSGGIRHLLVDEFQDTSAPQLQIVELLSSVHRNLFVVGDDAQSIYSFRGARVDHILEFRARRAGARVFSLTTNYRSGQAICDVANAVLAGSSKSIQKRLRAAADAPAVRRPALRVVVDDLAEARLVAAELARFRDAGGQLREAAVLMRKHAQSRALEHALTQARLPYRVLGGPRFWERREVRDLLAWLRCLANPRDAGAFRRALSSPARGIGERLIADVADACADGGDWLDACRAAAAGAAGSSRGRLALLDFARLIEQHRGYAAQLPVSAVIDGVLAASGLLAAYDDGTVEGDARAENLREVISAGESYAAGELAAFLDNAALEAAAGEASDDAVSLATLHAAKGLEWALVFIVGCEDGLLPMLRDEGDDEAIEEERRLFYVGVTRARRRLILTAAGSRMVNGQRVRLPVSRFVRGAAHTLERA